MNQYKKIDEYIAQFPTNIQTVLEKIRKLIRKLAPKAQETIKYGIPTFQLNGNLVHFAAFKNHIGFYPTPSAIVAFKEALIPYKQAKGSIQFPLEKPIPYDIIENIVKYRVMENESKQS